MAVGRVGAPRTSSHSTLKHESVALRVLRRSALCAGALLAALGIEPAAAQHLPSGGSVAAGSVSIAQPNSSTLNINQSTDQAIINWNSFSVGHGNTVNFNQPGASASTLNLAMACNGLPSNARRSALPLSGT